MLTPEEVLSFWLDEIGPAGWYAGGEELDQLVRDRFEAGWNEAMDGAYALWLTYPTGTLSYIILMDQLPRNMFRGQGKAFSSDIYALAASKVAIDRNWDMRVDEPARQFFYMPMMHSQSLCDQERCVRLMASRMPQTGEGNLLHARAHREVIRRFGRFPARNEALGQRSRAEEQDYLQQSGYGQILDELRQKQAAKAKMAQAM
ncbi:MAG: DUF924 family protein [Brevirhabdus sp.]